MSFQEPGFLWFALLLLVMLVLYLLPLPRRQIAASALYLWQRFLSTEPFGRASERFRRALGFALLAAILAFLVLAAAGLSVGGTSISARNVVVLVDVSASMNAVVNGKTNLSRAREAAGQLLESLDTGTELAVAEAAGKLQVLWPLGPGGRQAAAKVQRIEPFEGPCDMRRVLAESWELWGGLPGSEIYVFTDNELPKSNWGARAHAWIAPSIGAEGNAGLVAIGAERSASGPAEQRGQGIAVTFTLANYSRARRTLSGVILANGQARGSFESVTLDGGQAVQRSVRFAEPMEASIQVKLEGNSEVARASPPVGQDAVARASPPVGQDALVSDDSAFIVVPALEDMRVGVLWPEGRRRNDYVAAVLSAAQDEGLIGPLVENPQAGVPVTVYVNQLPSAWPEGGRGAIVLYPLRSGVIEVAGLHSEPLTIARQAQHSLLKGVDLRGLQVKGAVRAAVPDWAQPLVWADNSLPLLWAGETGQAGETPALRCKTKVLFVGIPVMPSGSRLPLVASFPVLMRNALQWMLRSPEALHPGEPLTLPSPPRGEGRVRGGWTSRKAGLVKGPDGRAHAFSVASVEESDLRRAPGLKGETFGQRHSLSMVLALSALALLLVEWGLFHRRMTE
jgi:hypothetical protein